MGNAGEPTSTKRAAIWLAHGPASRKVRFAASVALDWKGAMTVAGELSSWNYFVYALAAFNRLISSRTSL